MKRFNDYDKIAGIYDLLGKLVYRGELHQSQLHFFDQIPPALKILVIGGGTGRILNPLIEQCNPGQVVYVEKSKQMIRLSKKNAKQEHHDKIEFVHGTQDDLHDRDYDLVITPFFFDQFTYYRLAKIFLQLEKVVKKEGLWIWADFVEPRTFYHRFLMRLMLIFFKTSTNLGTDRVYSIYPVFERKNWKVEGKASYFGGFMETAMFRKN